MNKDKVKRILNTDIISEVGKVLGKDYKTFDDNENNILLATAFTFNKMKGDVLKGNKDTHMNMSWVYFQEVVEGLGFEKVWTLDFNGTSGLEEMAVWARKDGLIIKAESYSWSGGDKDRQVNGGDLYGQCRFTKGDDAWDVFSGCSHGPIDYKQNEDCYNRYFHRDVREGLRAFVEELVDSGVHLYDKWIDLNSVCFWLMNYKDWEAKRNGDDLMVERLTYERIKQFPEWVQNILGDIEGYYEEKLNKEGK